MTVRILPSLYRRPQDARTTTDEEHAFYSSKRWTRMSQRQRANEPLCRECAKKGIVTAAAVADHIVPIRAGGDRWDEGNLQSLCHPCHNSKRNHERQF